MRTLPSPLSDYLEEEGTDRLVWLPEVGMGYFPVTDEESPYDRAYFEKYAGYARTDLGRSITDFRVDLVGRHAGIRATVVDVGIGCGDFITARDDELEGGKTLGYDVNPTAVRWLGERDILVQFWTGDDTKWPVLTFWDSLEHMPDPAAALQKAESFAFVTIPVFQDGDHVLRSKHYRKDEHLWYWTRAGFIRWAQAQGFECVEHLTTESLLGREDVETFVLWRTS